VGPGNHVLDEGPDPPWGGVILRGEGRPIVKYRYTLQSSVQKWLNQSRCRLGCGPKESCKITIQSPYRKRQFWRKGRPFIVQGFSAVSCEKNG